MLAPVGSNGSKCARVKCRVSSFDEDVNNSCERARKKSSTVKQNLQTPQLSLHLVSMPTGPGAEFFQIF